MTRFSLLLQLSLILAPLYGALAQSKNTTGTSGNRLQLLSIKDLREIKTLEEDSFILDAGPRSGTFRKAGNASRSDDSSMVLKIGSVTYERVVDQFIRPEFFGASGDSTTDDTRAIQKAINYAGKNRIPLHFTGKYRIVRSGSLGNNWSQTNETYALLIDGVNGLAMKWDGSAGFILNNPNENLSAIRIQNSSNIEIDGLICERAAKKEAGNTSRKNLELFSGAAVSIINSEAVTVRRIISNNLNHGVIAYRSKGVLIQNCLVKKINTAKSGSHLALYACENSTIENCITYSGTNDGDIGILGAPSRNNRISGCRVFNYEMGDKERTIPPFLYYAQGIFVDSGSENAIISNNHVYGFYYGIDVKTVSNKTIVQSNSVENCIVGIAGRRGEGNQPMTNLLIANNQISPDGGNGKQLTNWISSIPLGIFLEDCFGATVTGNVFENSMDAGTADFVGIMIRQSNGAAFHRSRQSPILITSNRFNLESLIADKAGRSRQPCITMTGSKSQRLKDVNISNNTFDPVYYQNSSKGIITAEYVENLTINNNSFSDLDGDAAIRLANCTSILVQANHFSTHTGLVHATNVRGLSFANNLSNENKSAKPSIELISGQYAYITGHTRFAKTEKTPPELFIRADKGSDYITLKNNSLTDTNSPPSSEYKLDPAIKNITIGDESIRKAK